MNKKPNLFNQVIISSIEDYKNKIETLTKQKERLIRRDKKHREEIERLNKELVFERQIKKEAREYVNNHQLVFELSSKKQIAYWFDMFYKELLEILGKVGDSNE